MLVSITPSNPFTLHFGKPNTTQVPADRLASTSNIGTIDLPCAGINTSPEQPPHPPALADPGQEQLIVTSTSPPTISAADVDQFLCCRS
jgi:hypothetical protein